MSAPEAETDHAPVSSDASTPAGVTPRAYPRSRLVSALVTLAVLVLLAGAWLVYVVLTRPLASTPDMAEMRALDARLTAIENEMRPIAAAFTSESSTAPIDVDAYAGRIAHLRDLIDSTNDLAASTPDALEVRDLILTGGAQVAEGMNAALDALVSDNATAATPAASRLEEGLANLAEARRRLDMVLGRLQPA